MCIDFDPRERLWVGSWLEFCVFVGMDGFERCHLSTTSISQSILPVTNNLGVKRKQGARLFVFTYSTHVCIIKGTLESCVCQESIPAVRRMDRGIITSRFDEENQFILNLRMWSILYSSNQSCHHSKKIATLWNTAETQRINSFVIAHETDKW